MRMRNFLWILLVSGLLSGYAAWLPWERPGRENPAPAATDIPLIDLVQAEALWRQSSTLFVDVRSANDFAYGHIAGALSLPLEEFDKHFSVVKPRLEMARALVVYCKSVDCGKSLWAALRLRQQGLTQTKIFPAGWHEWSDKKLPSSRTAVR